MPLCSHCMPIFPLGRALAPHLCCHSRCCALANCRILQPYLRSTEFGIVLKQGRHGGRSRYFCVKDDYRVSNNAPVGRVKRKIVEHIILLKGKADLSDINEKDMLDFLYTSQYHMRGIIAISMGRLEDPNIDNITHAVYMRFQRREDLARFSANPHFLEVLKEHVFPYCYGSLTVDYECEVEDEMLSIFRRGEDFNYGVECILLISMFEASLAHAIEDAILALQNLVEEFSSLIVQGTHGSIFSNGDSGYTHASIIRFPSLEAFELFRCSSKYKDIWRSKFQPITKKALLIHFKVDPVGTELF